MFIIDYKINKCLHDVRDYLTSEFLTYLERYGNKITQNKRDLAKKAVSCLLLNLYTKHSTKQNALHITLDKNHYSKSVIVNGKNTGRKVSYTYMRSLLDFLEFEDYITLEKGKVNSFTFRFGYYEILDSESSKIVIKPKLTNILNNLVTDWKQEPLSNVIRLRDINKNEITFKMKGLVREVRDYLYDFNKFSLTKVVSLRDIVYDVQMYKVYNRSSFNKGARSFMKDSIQNLSKQDRHDLVIDNIPVCAFDYKGFEPSLTYSIEQEVMECEDPYELHLDGYDDGLLRKICKTALLIMLNADSKEEAFSAINLNIAKEYNLEKLYMEDKIPSTYIPTKVIMGLLEEKHHLIAHRFYKSFGLEVQYIGSLINDFVVSYMMQNYEQLVLQVFDEFLCQNTHADKLEMAMKLAFQHVFGNDKNCKIVREK